MKWALMEDPEEIAYIGECGSDGFGMYVLAGIALIFLLYFIVKKVKK